MLTAGLGTRLRPVTNRFAKPTVPFLGVPLACFARPLIESLGVREFVLNTHYLPEQIENLASEWRQDGLTVTTSFEPGEPLGSGGGIWKARALLEGGGDFLVCNGDEIILPHDPNTMQDFFNAHRARRALASILVMRHEQVGTQFGGVWCDSRGLVKGFGKDPKAFGPGCTGFHYIGLLALTDRIFDYLPKGESNILYDALAKAIANGETVQAIEGSFTWFETGNPGDYLRAIEVALELLEGAPAQDEPDVAVLRATLKKFGAPGAKLETRGDALVYLAPDAHLSRDAQVFGFAVLEKGARVEAGAVIENSVIFPGAIVKSGEHKKNEISLS